MSDKFEMTIKLQVTEPQALTLQAMFEYMNQIGSAGASRYVAFYADGDGDFQPKAECTFSQPVRPLDKDMRICAVVEDNHGNRKYDFDGLAWYLHGLDGDDPPSPIEPIKPENPAVKKALKHADKPYEGELKEGDWVVFQNFKEEAEGGIPNIRIELLEIVSIDKEKGTFIDKRWGNPQPLYRIRNVVNQEEMLAYPYTGYDQYAIQRDEGEITDKTYNEIMEALNGRR